MSTVPTAEQIADVQADLARLDRELREPLIAGLQELAALLRRPSPVHALPSDRWDGSETSIPDDRPVSVVGASPARLRVTLHNSGTAALRIGSDGANLSTSHGFPLAVGASVTLATAGAVYALAETSGGALAFIVEDRHA